MGRVQMEVACQTLREARDRRILQLEATMFSFINGAQLCNWNLKHNLQRKRTMEPPSAQLKTVTNAVLRGRSVIFHGKPIGYHYRSF